MRQVLSLLLFAAFTFPAFAAQAEIPCGEVVQIASHGDSTQRYALRRADAFNTAPVLILLVGGGGHLKLDAQGCPQALKGNSLIKMQPFFHQAGFSTILLDAPSDYMGDDGLAGFRIDPQHAHDIGRVITTLRQQTRAPIWLAGTSRGTISALNAASLLQGSAAPEGIIITSILSVGDARARKKWVAQTVFDLPLEAIRQPLLLVGHAADNCIRSPATQMQAVANRTHSRRLQIITMTGGPFPIGRPSSLDDCEGRAPHGYVEQEAEVATGIVAFIRGGRYPARSVQP